MAEFDDLRAENQALRQQITALEASLEARPKVDRATVFALIDAMPLLVAAVSADGTSEFISTAFEPWLTGDRDDLIGAAFSSALIESLRTDAEAMQSQALAGNMARRDLAAPNREGEIRHLDITVIPRRFGGGELSGCIWIAQDLTQQRTSDEALRASEVRFRMAADAAGLGVWDRDLADDTVVISDLACGIYGLPAGTAVTLEMLREATHPDDRHRVIDTALRHMDPKVRSRESCAYRVVWPDGEVRWVLAHGEAIFEMRDGLEVPVRYVGMLQDITEQTRADQRRRFLLHELNHRVKNTLASVQSIAHLSLRDARSVDSVRTQLTDRLIALAGAHDILTREDWRSAEVADIVGLAISPFEIPTAPRFSVLGPQAALAPKATVALALALHELATNAAKYGALSVDGGRVEIGWEVQAGDEPLLTLDWREVGGPPVSAPTRIGFGARLLTQGLAAEFGSAAQLHYRPEGLSCRIVAPITVSSLLELD